MPPLDLTLASLIFAQALHPEPTEMLERDNLPAHGGFFYSDAQNYVFRHPVNNRKTTVEGVRMAGGTPCPRYSPIDVKTGKPYNYNPF